MFFGEVGRFWTSMSPSEHKIVIMFGWDLRDRKEHFNLISEIASIMKYRFGYIKINPWRFPLLRGFQRVGQSRLIWYAMLWARVNLLWSMTSCSWLVCTRLTTKTDLLDFQILGLNSTNFILFIKGLSIVRLITQM